MKTRGGLILAVGLAACGVDMATPGIPAGARPDAADVDAEGVASADAGVVRDARTPDEAFVDALTRDAVASPDVVSPDAAASDAVGPPMPDATTDSLRPPPDAARDAGPAPDAGPPPPDAYVCPPLPAIDGVAAEGVPLAFTLACGAHLLVTFDVPSGCGGQVELSAPEGARAGAIRLLNAAGTLLDVTPLGAGTLHVASTQGGPHLVLEVDQTAGDPTELTLRTWHKCDVGRLVINEVDYNSPGADVTDFVEVLNAGPTEAVLTNLALFDVKAYRGARWINRRFPLDAVAPTLAPGATIVLANEGLIPSLPAGTLSISVSNGSIHNGPDMAFEIVDTAPAPWLVTPAGHPELRLDSATWAGSVPDVTEGGSMPDDVEAQALSRCPDGADTDDNRVDFTVRARTPGLANDCGG